MNSFSKQSNHTNLFYKHFIFTLFIEEIIFNDTLRSTDRKLL